MFKDNEKVLIVSDRDYFNLLFKFKNSHPSLDIKIIDKEELIDKLSFTLKKDPLPELLKLGKEYSKAKKYLNLLRVSNYEKNEELLSLFNSLKDEYFEKDEYGLVELKPYDIYLFEMNEDKELHSLIRRNNLEVKDLNFEELEIEETNKDDIKITYFGDKYYQYSYIYSDIRRKLKEDPTLKDKIKILIKDDSDIFFINLMSDIFKIHSLVKISKAFLENEDVKKKIESFYYSKSFAFEESELENERISKLKEIIDTYRLSELDFTFAYANLLEIVSSLKENSYLDDKGIRVDDKFKIDDSLVYVTNFVDGCFYKIYDDKNVLSDDELCEIDANASYISTALDRRKKANFLKYSHLLLVSRVKKHLKDNIYDSQFIAEHIDNFTEYLRKVEKIEDKDIIEERVNNEKQRIIVNKDFNENGLYTSEASKLYTSTRLDENFYYGEIEEFNSYDHSFKGCEKTDVIKNRPFSVTNLETYIDCPFKYLLSKIIPPVENDLLYANIGTFVHSFLEDINHSDFDFERSFERASKVYRKIVSESEEEFTHKDEVQLEILKNSLKLIAPSIVDMYKDVKCVDEEKGSEAKIEFEIKDNVEGEEKTYKFSGRIDKVLITENKSGERFYTVIDYKTGFKKFDRYLLNLGKDLQLPIYSYALESTESGQKIIGDAKFGGFGYQRVLYKTPKELFNVEANKETPYSFDTMYKQLQVVGFDKRDDSYYSALDLKSDAHHPLYSIPNYKKTFYVPYETLKNLALDGVKFVIRKINNKEFDIAPTSGDLTGNERKLACAYCPYRNVCFRTKKDIVSYQNKISVNKILYKGEK